MSNDARRLMAQRLRARLDAGEPLNYPQLPADIRSVFILLDHFEGDAAFLRREKAGVWTMIIDGSEETAAVVNSVLFVLGLLIGASVALMIYAGAQLGR